MTQDQDALIQQQKEENIREGGRSQSALEKQADYERQAAAQGAEAQNVAAAEQARYNAFDPEAYARAQTDAAGAMQAYQARRMGANAGKAARLGNFGLQQAQANATTQGLGIKSGMGQQAYGMRAGQQGTLGQFGAQKGQESLARTGLLQSGQAGLLNTIAEKHGVYKDTAEAGGNIAKGVSGALGIPSGPPTGMAKGGLVEKDKLYKVGEKGEELFVPKQDGTIIPNNITRELSEKGKKLMKDFLEATDIKRGKK